MVRPGKDCDDGYDHGGTLADHQSGYGEADRRLHIMLSEKVIDQVDGADPEDLLRQLGEGRNGSPADTVEVAVNAGVYRRHGNG